MVSSSLSSGSSRCCWVRVGRDEGVLLVCWVDVGRVFAPFDFPFSALFCCCVFFCTVRFILSSLVVEWQLDPGYHRFVIVVHFGLSRCFKVFAVLYAVEPLALFC